MVARAGERGKGKWVLMGMGVSFWGNENVLELDSDDASRTP